MCVHAGRGQDTCISEQYEGHTRGQSCGIAGLGGVRERRQGERAGQCALAVQGVTGHCADVDAGEHGVKTLASKVSRRERASWEVQAQSPHIRVLFDDTPFIVLTETKFSFRCIPVWDRYSPYRTRV